MSTQLVAGLYWQFDGSGEWEASSRFHDQGNHFSWRIGVCDDGTFAVSESDPELTDRKECFRSLDEAKEWCDDQERSQVFMAQTEPHAADLPGDVVDAEYQVIGWRDAVPGDAGRLARFWDVKGDAYQYGRLAGFPIVDGKIAFDCVHVEGEPSEGFFYAEVECV